MTVVSLKVLAYITNRGRLLVFRHTEYPGAGIQVPGGSVEPGEVVEQAALREALEETGLEALEMVSFLGVQEVDGALLGKTGLYRRYFYHFEAPGSPPDRWIHGEYSASDHSAPYYAFEFFWAALPGGVPALAGRQDAMLPELLESLRRAG